MTYVCQTCNGHGLIGGFLNAENGYQDDPCPECSVVVDETHPPKFNQPFYVNYWERSSDPWHQDALPTSVEAPRSGERKSGWMAIDCIENPIGFIPDGHLEVELEVPFDLKPGPCNRICAYRKDHYEPNM